MKTVAITQRVAVIPESGERRDCLDQAWPRFIASCGLLPLVLPNVTDVALALCEDSDLAGLVLTGGNDLAALGGDAPERDATENALLDALESRGLPVLGVCRGMQLIQQRCAIPLRRVGGHVTKRQTIRIDGEPAEVNSYHCFAALESRPPLEVWAVAADGVVKAVRQQGGPPLGPTDHRNHVASRAKHTFRNRRRGLVSPRFQPRVMRALILAAGRGSRMGALGDDRPKCLVELDGRPLLDRQLAALRRGGADEIGIVRGYRAHMLNVPGLCYFENKRWAETNMVMSLVAAAHWLRSAPVIISYADIFYRGALVRGLISAPGSLVISYDRAWRRLWARRFADPLSDAETFRTGASGELLEIGGRTGKIEDIDGQYMGLIKVTPTAWAAIEALLATLDQPTRDRLDVTALLRRLLAGKAISISTFGTDGQWGEIDSAADVDLYQSMVRDHELTLEDPFMVPAP